MRLSHARRAITVRFDDPNLVSCAGLVPVMALADRCGLPALLAEHVKIAAKGGANASMKILAIVAGMVCGADSIEDLDLLRHGGMPRLFEQIRAPSTLGTLLRLFTFGHVRQLDAVAARLLPALAAVVPVLPGADRFTIVDIDDTVRQTYGYAKQGAARGYTGIKGLNALLAIVSTTGSAPLIAAARLRKGSTNSARGAAKLLTDVLATVHRCGAGADRHATLLVRADSAYYGHDIIAAARRGGARFSVTARLTPTVVKAITSIDEQAWVAIRYPNAIYDEDEGRWVSDAEVAETVLTAFTGRRQRDHVTARLIVRRVRRLNPRTVPAGQSEAFAVYRYHAVFTDSSEPMLAAEATHRDHAIVEQVIAELKNGPLAHLPSGVFTANAAWLACAAMAFNLTRAAAVLAGGRHVRTRTATVRAQLIHTPARVAHSAHQQLLHLPAGWPWEAGLDELFRRALHDPPPAAA
jgi:Transposase DDE domain group 1